MTKARETEAGEGDCGHENKPPKVKEEEDRDIERPGGRQTRTLRPAGSEASGGGGTCGGHSPLAVGTQGWPRPGVTQPLRTPAAETPPLRCPASGVRPLFSPQSSPNRGEGPGLSSSTTPTPLHPRSKFSSGLRPATSPSGCTGPWLRPPPLHPLFSSCPHALLVASCLAGITA
uniref:Uncharacterized protein n=1 Tax=Molossus molossus TaxID=27622 RepID=A0A7J8ER52_MOLMO|nr:hypothetical protein HJG59_008698 [Molossus molossus]